MNRAIEMPSKAIEIITKSSAVSQFKNCPSLNFYEIDDESFLKPNKKSFMCEKTEINTDFHSITQEFVIEALKHDLRVRNFRKNSESEITVFFYTIEESISFYQQYFKMTEMYFKYENDLKICSSFDLNEIVLNFDLYPTEIYSFKDVQISKPIKVLETFEDFELRIDHFNKMKSIYSKGEIKRISNFMESSDFDYILINIKELCVGSATNLIIQSMIAEITDKQLCKLIKALGTDISAISCSKYGAYTIQKLIMACHSKKSQDLLVHNFGPQGRFLLCHEIGNYTIQRILLFNESYISDLFIKNLENMIQNELGIKVFKRCFELLKEKKGVVEALGKLKSSVAAEFLKDF